MAKNDEHILVHLDEALNMIAEKTGDVADCHIWTGGRGPTGNPIIMLEGRVVQVRRVVYFLEHGRFPSRITSSCPQNCINPKHFEQTEKVTVPDFAELLGKGEDADLLEVTRAFVALVERWEEAQRLRIGTLEALIKNLKESLEARIARPSDGRAELLQDVTDDPW